MFGEKNPGKMCNALAPSVFSVSIVDFEQVKSQLCSKSHRSKNMGDRSFVVCKKCLIYCTQRQTQNLWHV